MKTVIYVQHTDPAAYPPLLRSSWLLAERGWRVYFLGAQTEGAAGSLPMEFHTNITAELLPYPGRGPRHYYNYLRFLIRCRSEIQRLQPDVVYCSDLKSYPVGSWASQRPGLVTVLHEHDPPTTDGSPLIELLLAIRRRFARSASVCVVPQSERAAQFGRATGAERVLVAYNCPMLRELRFPRNAAVGDKLTLWYHGGLASQHLPPTIIDALARLPEDVRLELAGYETRSNMGFVRDLMARAAHLNVSKRVFFHGVIPQAALPNATATAHIGLAIFSSEYHLPMVGASNKPFDYLACGLPLLTNRTTEWEEFFGAKGVSLSCDPGNPDDIARAVLALRNDPALRQAMAARGRELIRTQWNYETQFAPVLKVLEGADRAKV